MTLTYGMSTDRAERLVARLQAAGYRAGMPPRRLSSTLQQVAIHDVDEAEQGHVHTLIKGWEPMANPIF